MSIDEFIKETNGHEYDMDGQYGVQCVDGIKKFTDMFDSSYDFCCGNGWANGLWLCYGDNGVEKYFNKHSFSEARKGDWIIWNKGSKSAPNSHVAMFMERTSDELVSSYGQSQNGIKAFNTCNLYTEGILGVLRLKELEPTPPQPTGFPWDGIVKKGSQLYNENGEKYNQANADRDVEVEGIKNGRYKVWGETFNPNVVYVDEENVIRKGEYPFNAIVKKGSQLYDANGNKYNKANADRQVTVQGELNGRYQVWGETFNPHVVYVDKDAIIR